MQPIGCRSLMPDRVLDRPSLVLPRALVLPIGCLLANSHAVIFLTCAREGREGGRGGGERGGRDAPHSRMPAFECYLSFLALTCYPRARGHPSRAASSQASAQVAGKSVRRIGARGAWTDRYPAREREGEARARAERESRHS